MNAFLRLFGVFWKRACKGYDDINCGFAQQNAMEIILHFTEYPPPRAPATSTVVVTTVSPSPIRRTGSNEPIAVW